jgi:hypothetical protein
VCEAVKDIRTDVELKENKIVLAAQWPFFGVTMLHYMLCGANAATLAYYGTAAGESVTV